MSIHTTRGGFSLAVFDTALRQIIRVNSFQSDRFDMAELDAAIEENRIVDHSVQSGILSQNHCRFTLVPAAFYDANRKRDLLARSTRISDCEIVATDPIPEMGMHIVYADKPKPKSLPNCQNLHFLTAFLQFIIKKELTREAEMCFFAHQYQNRLSVLIFRDQNLLLANAYNTYTAADTLYYLLVLFDNFSLSNERHKLNISGDLSGDQGLNQSLGAYFANCSELSDFRSRVHPEQSAEPLGLVQTHQIILE